MFNLLGQVTLPDTGVDLTGSINAAVTTLGGYVGVVVGAYFAFRAIKWGLQWAGSRTKG